MMTANEMKAFLLDELHEEWKKSITGENSKYGYLFMLCNDMGITGGPNAPIWAPKD